MRSAFLRLRGEILATTDKARVSVRSFVSRHRVNCLVALGFAVAVQTVLFGLDFSEFSRVQIVSEGIGCVALLTFVFLRMTTTRTGRRGLIAVAVLLGALMPLRSMTGSALVSATNLDTLLATDWDETLEFLSSIAPWRLAEGLPVALVLAVAAVSCSDETTAGARLMNSWAAMAWAVGVLIVPAFSPIGDIIGNYAMNGIMSATAGGSGRTWFVSGRLTGTPSNAIRVVFMDESLSTIFMGLYGAPYATTPFMSANAGPYLAKAVAPGSATTLCVRMFCALPDNTVFGVHFPDNIVALAKDAGMHTVWISSQGGTGAFTAGVSRIASSSDEQKFLSRHEDYGLLPAIRKAIESSDPDKGLFLFIHAYGAHERVCERVTDAEKQWKTGSALIDCYLGAALKADRMVEKTVGWLRASGRPWSMIFTSDHAVNVHRSGKDIVADRSQGNAVLHEVPFVIFDSEWSGAPMSYPVPWGTENFTKFFPTFIGVKSNKTPDGYSPFTRTAEQVREDGPITYFLNGQLLNDNKARHPYADLHPSVPLAELLRKN